MSEMNTSTFLPLQFLLFLSTWMVMMTAMMLPTAAPMIMTFAGMLGQSHPRLPAYYGATGFFTLGYLLAWGSLGLLAYMLNASFPRIAQLLPTLARHSAWIGGAVLVLAGAYQFSPLKNLCLSKCRTPLGYLMTHWRAGLSGALFMGAEHGLFCIGCCWALMTVLFVTGIMNLVWMAGLAFVMFIEKTSRHGVTLSKAAGIVLILTGLRMAFIMP